MILLRLAPNKLRSDDVTHAVRNKDRSSHETLLCVSSHVGHSDRDNQTHRPAEEARDRISHHRRRSAVRPFALPDNCTSGNYRQACKDEHENADVGKLGAEPPCQENNDEAQSTQGELE